MNPSLKQVTIAACVTHLNDLDYLKSRVEYLQQCIDSEDQFQADDAMRELATLHMDLVNSYGGIIQRAREAFGLPSIEELAREVEEGKHGSYSNKDVIKSKRAEIERAEHELMHAEPSALSGAITGANADLVTTTDDHELNKPQE